MKCFVCGNDMEKYFEKQFGEETHEYVRCKDCGMVVSKTIYEMPKGDWERMNICNHKSWHDGFQDSVVDEFDPRWIQRIQSQKDALIQLFTNRALKDDMNILDYGCGDGKLADSFNSEYAGTAKICKYDKYMADSYGGTGYLSDEDIYVKTWDLIITCSVLEHIVGINDLESIINMLNKDNGIFCLHTLICEEVPQDPKWFYLGLGHCTLYTNKAISILFHRYDFTACAYNVDSRFWFFFKNPEIMKEFENKDLTGKWVYSDHFVDYWKQRPYR